VPPKPNAASGNGALLGTYHSRRERFRARHIDYTHINPVKHGLVTRVRDWPYSSFHRLVKLEVYPEDWAGDVSDRDGELVPLV
jgi:hypothetical protein